MRKSKEVRIIEHGDDVLKELHRVYLEGIGIDEYTKLFKEYKKLNKRYEKVIKLADNMGNGVMETNDVLNDNLQYTIKTARSKLLENVSEHRKTKDAYAQYKERIVKYNDALVESYAQNAKLQKRLDSYIKQYGEINHTFTNQVKPSTLNNNMLINPVEYKNMNIHRIVALELSKEKNNFVLSKIKLNDFNEMIEVIEKNSSVDSFISGIYKYIKNCLHSDDIVFHEVNEIFYVITKKRKIEKVKDQFVNLNKKRKLFNFNISYSIGITEFIDGKDNEEILLRRCINAFKESEKTFKIVVK